MSVKSIQRAYREGDIPVQWLRRMARFNLAVRRAMKRNPQGRMRSLKSSFSTARATDGCSRYEP
ncbi:MAG: hypothetical protein ABI955_08535 [Nitrospirota bacterium]